MAVNIRRFVLQAHRLDELVALGTLTPHAARFHEAAVVSGLNVVVAGGTQAGKTMLTDCSAWIRAETVKCPRLWNHLPAARPAWATRGSREGSPVGARPERPGSDVLPTSPR